MDRLRFCFSALWLVSSFVSLSGCGDDDASLVDRFFGEWEAAAGYVCDCLTGAARDQCLDELQGPLDETRQCVSERVDENDPDTQATFECATDVMRSMRRCVEDLGCAQFEQFQACFDEIDSLGDCPMATSTGDVGACFADDAT